MLLPVRVDLGVVLVKGALRPLCVRILQRPSICASGVRGVACRGPAGALKALLGQLGGPLQFFQTGGRGEPTTVDLCSMQRQTLTVIAGLRLERLYAIR